MGKRKASVPMSINSARKKGSERRAATESATSQTKRGILSAGAAFEGSGIGRRVYNGSQRRPKPSDEPKTIIFAVAPRSV